MAIKIPADVSGVRRRMAEAAARRKMQLPPKKEEPVAPKPGDRKAGQEAADARRKAREAMQSAAERDVRVKELEDQLAAALKRAEDAEPSAKNWRDYDHKRTERLVAKFPKEEQVKVRKLGADALEMLVEARGLGDAGGAASGATGGKSTGSKFTSMDELTALSKSDPAAYNKGIDDITSGVIKIDSGGKVIA